MTRPPLPPFTVETAVEKARLAEDAWNSRDPKRVAQAYTADSLWRNRAAFIQGREQIKAFLTRKWAREFDYRLIKEVWADRESRIAVPFAYEWHDENGHWFRSYGNENWEFDEHGLMRRRIASINDLPIKEDNRVGGQDDPALRRAARRRSRPRTVPAWSPASWRIPSHMPANAMSSPATSAKMASNRRRSRHRRQGWRTRGQGRIAEGSKPSQGVVS